MADFAALRAHREATKSTRITELFDADPGRFGSFSASACGLTLDYSKTAIDAEGLNLLLGHAASTGVMARAEAMFAMPAVMQAARADSRYSIGVGALSPPHRTAG